MDYPSAIVQHLERKKFGLVYGAIYDQNQRLINDWPLLVSSQSVKPAPRVFQKPSSVVETGGDVIYGGAWWTAFGHILTEVTPALCAIISHTTCDDKRPIVFHSFYDVDLNNLPSYTHWFLERLGIAVSRLKIVKVPTRFDNLTVVPSPFTARYRYSSQTVSQLDNGFDLSPNTGARDIYLTRRGWGVNGKRTEDEKAIEALFADKGFECIEPSKLSLPEQFELVSNARTIAGYNGSALHWSLFSRSRPKVICLGWHLPLQEGICALRKQPYLSLPGRGIEKLKGRSNRRIDADYVRKHVFDGV